MLQGGRSSSGDSQPAAQQRAEPERPTASLRPVSAGASVTFRGYLAIRGELVEPRWALISYGLDKLRPNGIV